MTGDECIIMEEGKWIRLKSVFESKFLSNALARVCLLLKSFFRRRDHVGLKCRDAFSEACMKMMITTRISVMGMLAVTNTVKAMVTVTVAVTVLIRIRDIIVVRVTAMAVVAVMVMVAVLNVATIMAMVTVAVIVILIDTATVLVVVMALVRVRVVAGYDCSVRQA